MSPGPEPGEFDLVLRLSAAGLVWRAAGIDEASELKTQYCL